MSDEALLSFFGFGDWNDWRRANEEPDGERVGDELLENARPPQFHDRTGTSDELE